MKTLITLSLLIGTLLTSINAQQVTFQSYMSTVKWAESVTLNGNALNESSSDVFDIPAADVLPGTNIIEFNSLQNNLNGVTSLDVVLIKRALVNIAPLSVEGIIPADFDKSGFIGVNDIANMTANILGILSGIENAFIHPSVNLAALDPYDFGANVYKFEFQGEDLATTDFVFDVYVHGDVNMSALFAPEGEVEVEVRESNAIIAIDDINLIEGQTYEVPFKIESDKLIEAFQIGTNLNGISINSVELHSAQQKIETNISDENMKMLVVSDEANNNVEGVFSITANRNGVLSELFSQKEDFVDEIVYDDLTTAGMEIEFASVLAVGELSVDDVILSPNPVVDKIDISFPDRSTSTNLYISNAQGQLISSKVIYGNQTTVYRDELKAAGIYIVTLEQEGQTVQKKFIVL